jgi:hypothetical protein
MAETKLDLKGVIQVDDGDGWTSKPRDFKKIFEPFMNAIKAIRAEYPDHYIGLTYGANAHTQTPAMFNSYGFPNSASIRDTTKKLDPATTIDKVSIPKMLGIMSGGSGQAAVLSNPDVINMFTTNGINKFIIIPFDTMNSNVDKAGNGNLDAYGHKTDCLAFAEKFLKLPKSIIIGWRNGKSLQSKLTNNAERQKIVPGMDMLYFALGGGVAALDDPNLNPTTKDYIDFLIQHWDSESQKIIDSKIASVPDLKTKIGIDADAGKTKLGTDADAGKTKIGTDADAGKTKLGTDADAGKKLDGTDDTGEKLDATEKKLTGVTAAQIEALNAKLAGVRLTVADGDKNTAYGIAQEIFKAFFSGGGDKTKQTKGFLTSQVSALQELSMFSNKSSKAQLDEITRRIENPATAKKIELEEEEKEEEKDHLEKAAAEKKRKEEEAEKKRKEEEEAIGKQLRVMTFNVWFEALGIKPTKLFCTDSGGTNKCQDNIRAAILAEMDKPGPVVIFLQEFTYNFEEFFGPDVTIDSSLTAIESKTNVFSSSKPQPAIKAFRHFKIDYKEGRKFYVYIGQIGQSVMATIYSSELADESATEFFMGNLASGMNPDGDKTKHEIVPTFYGDKTKLKIDDIKHGGNPYDFRGGSRPFTILRFDTPNLKLILLNIHSPHSYLFGDLRDGKPLNPDPGAPKAPITVAQFAFTALGPFFTEHVFTSGSGIDKTDYTFVAGGDFNADANTAITRLTPIFQDANKTDRTANKTCCVDAPGKNFDSTVDHIFSTSVISDYKVYDSTKLVKSASGNMNYFSDHLPVYATVTLPTAPAGPS